MKFEAFVAKRYLLKGRKHSFISVISLVSIIGIAIGVAALIIALSLINGFHSDITGKLLNASAHIRITGGKGRGVENYQTIIKDINERFEEIVSAGPVVSGTVLLKGISYKNSSGALLKGIDLESPGEDEGRRIWKKYLQRGTLPVKKDEVFIGSEIAAQVGLMEYENCTVITPRPSDSSTAVRPKLNKLTVSGIFHSGVYELDNATVVSNLSTAQKLFGLEDKINYIQIYLEDMFDAEDTAEKLREVLPAHLTVLTWKDMHASLYSALKLEKAVLFFTLTLIIVVASLNIVAGLILLVSRKIKDIGILLSYGAAPRTIKRIFFIQGGIIGLVGTSVGVFIGLVFCYLANRFQLVKVPAELFQMKYVPFTVDPVDFSAVVAVTLVITFLAVLVPSRKAASVDVIEAIKDEI
ncbi:MAG: ABC transporter permease [bacterium]|nr:ABC transporter permease [bacterium]